jgi:hypothetical protein
MLWEELAHLTRVPPVSLAPGEGPTLLVDRPTRIGRALAESGAAKRVARTGNRYGFLLMDMANILGIHLETAVALLAAGSDRRGVDRSGRLVIRFEPPTFYDECGATHGEHFGAHFQFNLHRPWRKHRWPIEPGSACCPCRTSQAAEWAALQLATDLDEVAARLSTATCLAGQMGFACARVGYESVGQMYGDFFSHERTQILACFDLIGGPWAASAAIRSLRDRNIESSAALPYGKHQAARQASIIRALMTDSAGLRAAG